MKTQSKLEYVWVRPALTHTFEIGNIHIEVRGYYELTYRNIRDENGKFIKDDNGQYLREDKVSLSCEDWEYYKLTENGIEVKSPHDYVKHKKEIGVDIDQIVWGYIQEGQPKILEQIMNTTIKNIEI